MLQEEFTKAIAGDKDGQLDMEELDKLDQENAENEKKEANSSSPK